jgi:hypothetical protein
MQLPTEPETDVRLSKDIDTAAAMIGGATLGA